MRGSKFGVDFNPQFGYLRIVSDRGQNARSNVETGETIIDEDLRYPTRTPDPGVTGIAYANNVSKAADTTLYYIDADNSLLDTTASDKSGLLIKVGGLHAQTTRLAGFDIVTRDGKDRAFASLTPERPSGLYNIDLDTGEADLIGNIGPKKGTKVTDIAIPIGQR